MINNALLRAANEGHTAYLRALLARGAQPDARDSQGFTPLMLAAQGGYVDSVRALLERGANLEALNYAGATAEAIAAEKGHRVVAEQLRAARVARLTQ